MIDSWRTILYLPLGLLPSLFFTVRILQQWVQSERQGKSHVTPLFWRLSLAGQWLLFIHFVIQVQFPFALIQATNGLLSWRNLNLMKKRRISFKAMIFLLIAAPCIVALVFVLQSLFVIGEFDWIRTPTKLWNSERIHHSLGWHLLGTFGGILFASRFWVQWWLAERKNKSELNPFFWWISLSGSIVLLMYFLHTKDVINIVNYSFGLVPYTRNLLLIRRVRRTH